MNNQEKEMQLPSPTPSRFYLHVASTVKADKIAEFAVRDLIAVITPMNNIGWTRLATCSSLTGLPTRFLEVYESQSTQPVTGALGLLDNPAYKKLMDHCERRDVEMLRPMSYAPRESPNPKITGNSHLLYVLLTVKDGNLQRFSDLMEKVLPLFTDKKTFKDSGGWTLMAAGHGLHPPYRVMHLWRSADANNLDKLMHLLSESPEYTELNNNTIQHQDLMHGIVAFKGAGGTANKDS
jgi:hypothetical protein